MPVPESVTGALGDHHFAGLQTVPNQLLAH